MLREGRGHSWGTLKGTGDLVSQDGVGMGSGWRVRLLPPYRLFLYRLPLPQHRVVQDDFDDLSSNLGLGVDLTIWGSAQW